MSFFDDFVASVSGTNAEGLAELDKRDRKVLESNAWGAAGDALGSEMSATSHFMFGLHVRQAADFQAAQLRQAGGQAMASAERSAADVDLQTRLTLSRALAVAGASGGGASDPGVVTIMANDAARGAYLKQVALYQGADRQRLMGMQADAAEYEGKANERTSFVTAGAERAKGASNFMTAQANGASLYERFAARDRPRSNGSGDSDFSGNAGSPFGGY